MIDTFSLALSHALLLLVAWRLLARPDLDDDSADPNAPRAAFFARRPPPDGGDRAGA